MDTETEEVSATESSASVTGPSAKQSGTCRRRFGDEAKDQWCIGCQKKQTCIIKVGDEGDAAMETEEAAEGDAEEDEFGLVESALDSRLRPMMRRCDDDQMEEEEGEGEQDLVKLEVEEHQLADEAEAEEDEDEEEEEGDWSPHTTTNPSVGDYGRPYKTTSQDRRSRISSPVKVAVTPGRVAAGRGAVAGKPRGVIRGGRGGLPMVSVVRGGGRGSSPAPRGSPGRGVGQRPGRGGARDVFQQPNALPNTVHVIALTNCYVDLVKDKLVVKRAISDAASPSRYITLTPMTLSFMDLVRIKEAVSKMLDRVTISGPASLTGRLRTARRQAIGWVETRLRKDAELADMDAAAQTAPHGRQGQSKYAVVEAPPAARPSPGFAGPGRVLTPSRPPTAGRGRGAPAAGRQQPAAHATARGDSSSSRLVQAKVKNPKTSRDIVILQAKLRDLQNVGAELRRAVDYFNMEAQKERAKVSRLKEEYNVLSEKLTRMEESLLNKANPLLMSLIDKDRRKHLTAHDEVVLECGELLSEVGRENYSYVLEQGLPLLTGRELEEKTRGVPMNWSLDAIELALAAAPPEAPAAGATPRGRGRGRGSRGSRGGQRGRPRKSLPGAGGDVSVSTPGGTKSADAETPAKRAQDGAAQVDSGEHISLPQEVLEQVMNGKGYLVDENGERLEIRMVGDNPVIAGAQ